MHVTGQLPEGVEPFETIVRVEFFDETDGRTRLKIRQWLPKHLTGNAEQGWLEALTKLDATLIGTQTSPSMSFAHRAALYAEYRLEGA